MDDPNAHRDRTSPSDPFPSELETDLRSLFDGPGAVPSRVDDQVRAAIAAHAGRRGRRRARLLGAGALAAAVGLAVALPLLQLRTRTPPPIEFADATGSITGDIDGNGRVDIVDALLVRNAITNASGRDAFDLTGDGMIDLADVDAIATLAVRLDLPADPQEGAG